MSNSVNGTTTTSSGTPSANPPRSRFASESAMSLLVDSLKDRMLFAIPKKGMPANPKQVYGEPFLMGSLLRKCRKTVREVYRAARR